MKIALVAPFVLYCTEYPLSEFTPLDELLRPQAQAFRSYSPSDSLLTLAALTPPEHELIYMDDQFYSIDTTREVDVAAITVATVSADRAYKIADEFRKIGTHVIMGGVHPTFCPEEAQKHADSVVVGDAEKVWPRFLEDFKSAKPKKIYDGGEAKLSESPPPRISLLSRDCYYRKGLRLEAYAMRTSVGCSRACKFCSNWYKPGCSRLRKKNMGQIERELDQITALSDRFILFLIDDNPFLDIKHIRPILERLRDRRIPWISGADISVSDHPRLLDLVRESGNVLLSFGLESLKTENLTWLAPWKARFVGTYRERIKIIRDHGINIMGSFIAGLDYDTPAVFRETFEFFMETKLSATNIGILTPYPGTQLREKLLSENRLDTAAPWSAYTGYNLLFKHPTLSKKDIYDGILWFNKQLGRPEILAHVQNVIFKRRE